MAHAEKIRVQTGLQQLRDYLDQVKSDTDQDASEASVLRLELMKESKFEGGKVLDGRSMINNSVETRLKSMDGVARLVETL